MPMPMPSNPRDEVCLRTTCSTMIRVPTVNSTASGVYNRKLMRTANSVSLDMATSGICHVDMARNKNKDSLGTDRPTSVAGLPADRLYRYSNLTQPLL